LSKSKKYKLNTLNTIKNANRFSNMIDRLKIAIVHDFLFQYGGAEKVVEKWLEMYPHAHVYTSFAIPEKFSSSPIFCKAFEEGRVHTTAAQKLFDWKNKNEERILQKYQKHLFWLYPILMRLNTIKDFDVVLISSTDCAKQVRYENVPKLIHYCHSPTRYLHGLTTETEHATLPLIQRICIPFFKLFLKPLDLWAVKYLNKKGCIWLANSEYIQANIWDKYKTMSQIVYPPIETEKFRKIVRKPLKIEKNQFYLCHGRISFHKRIDLAILSCLQLGRKLKISGTSALEKQMNDLKTIVADYEANNPSKKGLIEFLGRTSDEQLKKLISQCKAFVFPGKEDFGIAPIEMLSSGVPLIAYGAGGALEYVKHGKNGVLFEKQTVSDLTKAILDFEELNDKDKFDTKFVIESGQKFDEKVFEGKIRELVEC
jgi:glycosyltransferase involved in cell wall biosynthesis